ncbi:MAG: DNA-binding response regulator [Acidobacteria bacterium]|nr:DNA-binding response regulator [Acidobacteriota bacterium]
MPPIRIVIADDHALFRDGLRMLLESERGLDVVGEAADGEQAVKLARRHKPDILLLDWAMPRLQGLDVLQDLAPLSESVRIIVLTASIENKQILEALQRGARGMVLKESATEVLLKSIRAVVAGQYWIGRERVGDLVEAVRSLTPSFRDEQITPRPFRLTPREREIVGAVVAGFANKEIAQKFALSEDTVKHHLTNIFNKTGVSNRLELAVAAIHHGLAGEA